MLSFDTNVLYAAVELSHPDHLRAIAFMGELDDRENVAISEFALLELYTLLRNPAVNVHPHTPGNAV